MHPWISLYASVGPRLTHYHLSTDTGDLAPCGHAAFPARVQYGAFHPSRRHLYIVASDARPEDEDAGPAPRHTLHVLAVDPASGAPSPQGPPVPLPQRPIVVAVDPTGRWLLVCFVTPSRLAVYPIEPDGAVGPRLPQAPTLDFGFVGHDVVFGPGQAPQALMVTRGNNATADTPEEPGALRPFALLDGRLAPLPPVAPGGGYGFGPRNAAFHPGGRFLFVSLERQNALQVFDVRAGQVAGPDALFTRPTLRPGAPLRPRQFTGAVHVHPAGHAVYVANRAEGTETIDGVRVFNGGDNSIAVYAVDPATGEPTPLQHIDSRVMHARTFQVDASGSLLVAAGIKSREVLDHAQWPVRLATVHAGLSLFRIRPDGSLEFWRKHDIDAGRDMLFWMDLLPEAPELD